MPRCSGACHRHRHRAVHVDPAHRRTVAEIPPYRSSMPFATLPNFAYRSAFEALSQKHNGSLDLRPLLSREAAPDAFMAASPPPSPAGRLEAQVGIALTPENSHCMLCGNPQMVTDTMAAPRKQRFANIDAERPANQY